MVLLPRVRRAKVNKTKHLGKDWKVHFLCVVKNGGFIKVLTHCCDNLFECPYTCRILNYRSSAYCKCTNISSLYWK